MLAAPGDLILLAGKGHKKPYQIVGTEKLYFSTTASRSQPASRLVARHTRK